jgi:hypothetical protein
MKLLSDRCRSTGAPVARRHPIEEARLKARARAAGNEQHSPPGECTKEVMNMRGTKFRLTIEWDGRSLKIALEPY